MPRITPRPIPPTISHGSGLTREHIHGALHTTSSDLKGRYWLLLLVPMLIVFAIGTAVLP